MNFSIVLALSPHTDDAELGAGATLARLIGHGSQVHIAAFSTGTEGVGATPEEFGCAMKAIGATTWTLYNFPSRFYPDLRQDILDSIEELLANIQPAVMLCPSLHDTHQDHRTVAMEALRACKRRCSLLSYEMPWNVVAEPFTPSFYVKLTEPLLEAKMRALDCYKSQIVKPYMQAEAVYSLARTRGLQCGARYAEAFEVVRWIM
jgi:LmbE family N-acetylglucosaminyl deacetylase